MKAPIGRPLLIVAVTAAILLPAHSALAFSDVPSNYWDATAIKYVATTHTWMQDFGTGLFKPTANETRALLARTLVNAFASSESTDPSITFKDVSKTDPFYRYANIAVKRGWILKYANGNWNPPGYVPKSAFDQAIVLAMGLSGPVKGLAGIHQADGTKYTVGARFAHMQLAAYLGLHYNHSTESLDLGPTTLMHRDEAAYSLYISKVVPSWELANAQRFSTITLPALNPAVSSGDRTKENLTTFALAQVGFPYIWAGEWNAASPSGYCCGSQPQGGFDCSGFVWFVLKKYEDGYNAAQFHTSYVGWSLEQRTSSTMAQNTPTKISFDHLMIGMPMFFASNGGNTYQDVDHVGIYIGSNWMIHSTSGGPQIEWVGSGWYRDHFVWGRALSSRSSTASARAAAAWPADLAAGEGPVNDGRAFEADADS